jgi:hypothetical protein
LLAALALWLAAGRRGSFAQALSLAVHASVAPAVGQIVATPLHYMRESLTTPLNLGTVLPLLDEGTLPARVLGSVDLFALWWLGLLAIGAASMTRRPARGYLGRALVLYTGIAAALTVVQAVSGGS